jgi:hypothetical protein
LFTLWLLNTWLEDRDLSAFGPTAHYAASKY